MEIFPDDCFDCPYFEYDEFETWEITWCQICEQHTGGQIPPWCPLKELWRR